MYASPRCGHYLSAPRIYVHIYIYIRYQHVSGIASCMCVCELVLFAKWFRDWVVHISESELVEWLKVSARYTRKKK